MRLSGFQPFLLLAPTIVTSLTERQASANTPDLMDDAASLVSVYVPAAVYTQLTASVAAAAAAASVTGDAGSLFLSAILATTPPAWFGSAVPAYFSSNIAALESAVSTLRNEATQTTSSSETLVVTRTTNSLGSTVTTSYTSTLPTTATTTSSSRTSSATGNAAAPTVGAQQQAGLGIAALALGLAAIL